MQWPLASAPLASSASASSSSGRNRYDSLVPILADFGCGLVSGKNNYSYTIRNRRFLLQKINIRIYIYVCVLCTWAIYWLLLPPLPHVHNVYGEKTNVDQNYPKKEPWRNSHIIHHYIWIHITILCSVWSDRNGPNNPSPSQHIPTAKDAALFLPSFGSLQTVVALWADILRSIFLAKLLLKRQQQ